MMIVGLYTHSGQHVEQYPLLKSCDRLLRKYLMHMVQKYPVLYSVGQDRKCHYPMRSPIKEMQAIHIKHLWYKADITSKYRTPDLGPPTVRSSQI
jgi:hypothetical protein